MQNRNISVRSKQAAIFELSGEAIMFSKWTVAQITMWSTKNIVCMVLWWCWCHPLPKYLYRKQALSFACSNWICVKQLFMHVMKTLFQIRKCCTVNDKNVSNVFSDTQMAADFMCVLNQVLSDLSSHNVFVEYFYL